MACRVCRGRRGEGGRVSQCGPGVEGAGRAELASYDATAACHTAPPPCALAASAHLHLLLQDGAVAATTRVIVHAVLVSHLGQGSGAGGWVCEGQGVERASRHAEHAACSAVPPSDPLPRRRRTWPPERPRPNWRPSTKPQSKSTRMGRSSSMVPLMYCDAKGLEVWKRRGGRSAKRDRRRLSHQAPASARKADQAAPSFPAPHRPPPCSSPLCPRACSTQQSRSRRA